MEEIDAMKGITDGEKAVVVLAIHGLEELPPEQKKQVEQGAIEEIKMSMLAGMFLGEAVNPNAKDTQSSQ
jgi:hypothetical protein